LDFDFRVAGKKLTAGSDGGICEGMDSWFDIGAELTVAVHFREWREAPWLAPVICEGDGPPGRMRAYELIEGPHRTRIEAAVRQWLKNGSLPELDHPAQYCLVLRFAVLGHLLSSFDDVFPAPKKEEIPALYEKFLIDWWRKNGSNYAVGFTCAEYDLNMSP